MICFGYDGRFLAHIIKCSVNVNDMFSNASGLDLEHLQTVVILGTAGPNCEGKGRDGSTAPGEHANVILRAILNNV